MLHLVHPANDWVPSKPEQDTKWNHTYTIIMEITSKIFFNSHPHCSAKEPSFAPLGTMLPSFHEHARTRLGHKQFIRICLLQGETLMTQSQGREGGSLYLSLEPFELSTYIAYSLISFQNLKPSPLSFHKRKRVS